ncbi:MAG: methylmalonyl Co-A mutase-associated GTPase MeaB [Flavobacterium sp.]
MTDRSKHSALHEKEGVTPPKTVSTVVANVIKNKRKQTLNPEVLLQRILEGNVTALSQAITLVESTATKHQEQAQWLIQQCLPFANRSIRVGITGVPGVGKSTFIESLGVHLCDKGKKVAVLAVDPSSSLSKGSILGDKTRMEELVKHSDAYIRPSAAGDSLGGVARKTRESIWLCEAAGFDTILVETVGVGQSETAVHSMVDYFLLLKISGAGDELQGIKRGIMEMADAIVINKADGDNIKKANLAKVEFNRALHLFPPKASGWQPKVSTCSALQHEGIDQIWNTIASFIAFTEKSGYFAKHRADQNQFWMMETINEQLKNHFYNHPEIIDLLNKKKKAVQNDALSPFAAAMELLSTYFK